MPLNQIVSIQDYIKNKKYSNNLNEYNKLIRKMKKPSDFTNIINYIIYCEQIQDKLHMDKWMKNRKLALLTDYMIDELHLLSKTPSEKVLSEYIFYLKNK